MCVGWIIFAGATICGGYKKNIPLQRSQFTESLTAPEPPEAFSPELAALWWLTNRNWQLAHDLIDAESGQDAAWIHALLHRMEGDKANAAYWYARSGRTSQENTIGQELEALLDYFLERA